MSGLNRKTAGLKLRTFHVKFIRVNSTTKEGKSYAAISRHYGVNESTIRGIKKDEVNIRKTAAITFNTTVKRVVTSRTKTNIRMEAALALWIADCQRKDIPLDTNMITIKAKLLYDTFAAKETEDGQGEDEDLDNQQAGTSSDLQPRKRFSASKGWFQKFQKRYGLKSISLHGEVASADKDAAEAYIRETFHEINAEGGYRPEQVFNINETGLYWKRMPSRTFHFKDEEKASGFKAHKDRMTSLMCGNAGGFC